MATLIGCVSKLEVWRCRLTLDILLCFVDEQLVTIFWFPTYFSISIKKIELFATHTRTQNGSMTWYFYFVDKRLCLISDTHFSGKSNCVAKTCILHPDWACALWHQRQNVLLCYHSMPKNAQFDSFAGLRMVWGLSNKPIWWLSRKSFIHF